MKEIHPLARPSSPAGKIVFIHSDNKEHSFSFCTNDLTGSVMSWFDNSPPSIDADNIKKILKNIKVKAKKVVREIGKVK